MPDGSPGPCKVCGDDNGEPTLCPGPVAERDTIAELRARLKRLHEAVCIPDCDCGPLLCGPLLTMVDEAPPTSERQPIRESTDLDILLDLVRIEVEQAEAKWPRYASHHEAYAVLLEEVDEFWEEVRKKRSERDAAEVRGELVQVAAVALRAILSVCSCSKCQTQSTIACEDCLVLLCNEHTLTGVVPGSVPDAKPVCEACHVKTGSITGGGR